MFQSKLYNLVILFLLFSLNIEAASIHPAFIDGNPILATDMNARFLELKSKLNNLSINISLENFNENEPITAAKINNNLAVFRSQGAEISDVQIDQVINANTINNIFLSLNNFIDNSLVVLSPNNSANYNIFTAAGSRTDKVRVILNIRSGVDIYSTNATIPALTTGTGWHPESSIKIVNSGRILGMGGAGAEGGYSGPQNQWIAGFQGQKGGDAIELFFPVQITNNNIIFGGGGGGSSAATFHGRSTAACGGGGGGGQGYGGSAGGPLGACIPGYSPTRTVGGGGNINGPGGGGNQGASYIFISGAGGRGGYWGEAGASSAISTSQHTWGNAAGTIGGAAGFAIKRNGNVVTWISGNNASQVKGPQ